MPAPDTAPLVSVLGLSHIVVRVADLDRSLDFYRSVLGFRLYRDNRRPASPDLAPSIVGVVADTALELIETRHEPVRRAREEPGYSLIAFSVADVEAALDTLKSRGLTRFPEVISPGGGPSRLIMFRDPDGNVLELIQLPGARSMAEVLSRDAPNAPVG